jgi:hypothetical protein
MHHERLVLAAIPDAVLALIVHNHARRNARSGRDPVAEAGKSTDIRSSRFPARILVWTLLVYCIVALLKSERHVRALNVLVVIR